ncbi:MAG TPA: radical SAM protein [Kiritimatiellia bacterium]|nr:radical SAM protein [Kiritimatiellia bacterium]HRU70634.1 radical SAM protein [Kiritimatiellia bacterium]
MTQNTPDILLVAVNARYSHCAFAPRTLIANLGPLASCASLLESDLEITPLQLAERIAARTPRVVGFSVYLWNVRLIEATVRILRVVAPDMRLAAGGPELTDDYPNADLFDAVIAGEGERAFRAFCETVLTGEGDPPRSSLLVNKTGEDLETLALPYDLYTDTDLTQRTVYVETSRGCPFSCAYCTSAGTGLRLMPLDRLLPAFDKLWRRGLRRFKFLDRSFNAPVKHACEILDFFLNRVTDDTCLHMEIQPDRLHPDVLSRLAAFPAGTLHLEVGVQTLTPHVAAAIGRSRDTARTLETVRALARETGATVHADLIFGLPGENEKTFARGFNTLVSVCDPPELQVNWLKGLPGTRFVREARQFGLVFSPEPPYELLCSDAMDFATLSRIQRFARCWELVHNRGHFSEACLRLHALAGGDFYACYQALADYLYAAEGKLFAIARPRLAALLDDFLSSRPPPGATATPNPLHSHER